MDEIKLMERLKDFRVSEVCGTIIDIANEFSLEYCFRNDCQHVSGNIGIASELTAYSGKLKVEDLVEYPSLFGDLRFLLKEVIKQRGLKPSRTNPYDPRIEPVEFRQYCSEDEFIERISQPTLCFD